MSMSLQQLENFIDRSDFQSFEENLFSQIGECNAPLFSRAALRRSSQKMQISFFENPLCRPFLFYAADA